MEEVSSIAYGVHQILRQGHYDGIRSFDGFDYVSSVIKSDPFHNYFFVTSNSPQGLDEDAMIKILRNLRKDNLDAFLYLKADHVESFTDFICSHKLVERGVDSYMVKNLTSTKEVALPNGFVLTTDYDFDQMANMLVECFDGWQDEKEYAAVYEKLRHQNVDGFVFETYAITFDGKVVASGAVALGRKQNLAYYHNTGVDARYRRKGLYTALISARDNFALQNGVNKVVAITEPNGDAFKAMGKEGFKEEDRFILYAFP
ncbi:GNAT family N-acetyltransferase [candidate division WWE3 bacterium]|uniref:GNAT family N-acetyltransferase n=1 Tax=candidate division WWE3 bacterium TaxID=2053526 RepID=A0A955LM81_UNCKA|nr:GNAT family N-acetyltransferase [candidate division WWE3 bacterium]